MDTDELRADLDQIIREADALVAAMDRLRARLPLVFAVAVLVCFLAYYGVACFRAPWGGDLQLYAAAVAELYRHYLHPAHETMRAPGSLSTAMAPRCALRMPCTTESPRPVPCPTGLVV